MPLAHRETSAGISCRIGTSIIQRNGSLVILFVAALALSLTGNNAIAFRVQDVPPLPDFTTGGIGRWMATPYSIEGLERSLDGGLRYSISGGSYGTFLDEFQWEGDPPSVPDFQKAVEQAFADWEQIDPATGLGTDLQFVPDFETPIVIEPHPTNLEEGLKIARGSEIDIAGEVLDGQRANARIFGQRNQDTLTLTSGVTDYPGVPITGADIRMATNRNWESLLEFQTVLSHEIGHAIGLSDIDATHERGCCRSLFYDDNFDNSTHKTARETLTNSFAELIDPFDPDNSSGLGLFDACTSLRTDPNFEPCPSSPGIDTPGVDLHMETSPQVRPLPGPQNDDFAGRQFLYPFVRVTGDFDADKEITVSDVDLLIDEINAEQPRTWFDLNKDQVVDTDDLGMWVRDIQNTWIGDANLDGEFNSGDFVEVFKAGKYEAGVAASWSEGDWNGDQVSDSGDFIVAFQDQGYEQGPRPGFAAVPEPSGFWLQLAFLGVFLSQRRRSSLLRSSHFRTSF